MRLEFAQLAAAMPKPPVPKHEWGYRVWYAGRKNGWISLTSAARLCELADIVIEDVYPQLSGIDDGYDGDILWRTCKRCSNLFAAHKKGKRGSPRTSCIKCPPVTKNCKHCHKVFSGSKQQIYCSQFCASQIAKKKRNDRLRLSRNEVINRTCTRCANAYECRTASRSRYCAQCRQERMEESTRYISPYPMCASCGKLKKKTLATCGAEECKSRHRAAKTAASVYKISPEDVMVLRACPRCDACKSDFDATDPLRKQCIDHCHKTGRIRGVLCGSCNVALGFAREDATRLHALAEYARERV